jgi:AcrR family transcriptional regulator
MPPSRRPERLVAIVDAATDVFGRTGFRQAQMADIAAAAGVSVGTLYNYVEGKDALLLLCAENPFGGVARNRPLPVTVPDRRALLAAVESTLSEHVRVPTLDAALARDGIADDVPAELSTIVAELFDLLAQTRRAADAMERCAREAPDLAELFYRGVRGRLLTDLGTYLGRLRDAGAVALSVEPALAARFVMEVTTWWARHRHHDPDPPAVDDAGARDTAITLVLHALCGVLP